MSATYNYRAFDEEGKLVGGQQGFLPPYLDWMPIAAKAEWFRFIGMGDPRTKTVLLESQGEQLLLFEVTLQNLKHVEYKEKERDAEDHTQGYIDREGISRTPRNQ